MTECMPTRQTARTGRDKCIVSRELLEGECPRPLAQPL